MADEAPMITLVFQGGQQLMLGGTPWGIYAMVEGIKAAWAGQDGPACTADLPGGDAYVFNANAVQSIYVPEALRLRRQD